MAKVNITPNFEQSFDLQSIKAPYEQLQEPDTRALFLSETPETNSIENSIDLNCVYALGSHLRSLLSGHRKRRDRNRLAVEYADLYRLDPEIDGPREVYNEESELVVARLYLSAVGSQGRLGQFIEARSWAPKGSSSATSAKASYLEARKRFQNDVDNYFDHFADRPVEAVDKALQETVCSSRLLVTGYEAVDSLTVTYTHLFLGSVLSERAVKVSLREYVHPDTRYGTVEEDMFPTMADVVVPLEHGDMPVQVKMKWQSPTELKVKPRKKPLHVIVPMHIIRSGLTSEEDEKLALTIAEEAEKLAA